MIYQQSAEPCWRFAQRTRHEVNEDYSRKHKIETIWRPLYQQTDATNLRHRGWLHSRSPEKDAGNSQLDRATLEQWTKQWSFCAVRRVRSQLLDDKHQESDIATRWVQWLFLACQLKNILHVREHQLKDWWQRGAATQDNSTWHPHSEYWWTSKTNLDDQRHLWYNFIRA